MSLSAFDFDLASTVLRLNENIYFEPDPGVRKNINELRGPLLGETAL